jgi:hypothetical protein
LKFSSCQIRTVEGESSFARARENSDAAYKAGVVSLIEVLDADANLVQMRDAGKSRSLPKQRARPLPLPSVRRRMGCATSTKHSLTP